MGLINDRAKGELLMRIRASAECRHALASLQGEVLQIIITDVPSEFRMAFRGASVEEDPTASPTITVEGEQAVMSRILEGELDPLIAIVTRKLKAKADPVRGPLLRTIFRAGGQQRTGDMNWARLFNG